MKRYPPVPAAVCITSTVQRMDLASAAFINIYILSFQQCSEKQNNKKSSHEGKKAHLGEEHDHIIGIGKREETTVSDIVVTDPVAANTQIQIHKYENTQIQIYHLLSSVHQI